MRCLACDHPISSSPMKLSEWCVYRCPACGLGHTYPVPSLEEMTSLNNEVYSLASRLQVYKSRHHELSRRYRRQLEWIAQSKPAGKLLDIGCNLGFFVAAAQKQGYLASGIDLSTACTEYARSVLGVDAIAGELTTAGYGDKSFDIVTLWDVLEHIATPRSFLREVGRILRDDGAVIVQTPNADSTMARLTGDRWSWWTVPDHLFHYTPRSLPLLLAQAGFSVTELHTWDPTRDYAANLLSCGLGLSAERNTPAARVCRRMVRLATAVLAPFSVPSFSARRLRHTGAIITLYAVKSENVAGSDC